MNYARKDFVRVFHPSADEEYRNNPVFERNTVRGVLSALLVGGWGLLGVLGVFQLAEIFAGVVG